MPSKHHNEHDEAYADTLPPDRHMKRRGFGYTPDTPEQVAATPVMKGLMGAAGRLPLSASLEGYITRVNDQQHTSSCVGQAIQQCANIRLARMGVPTRKFSPLAVYSVARMMDRGSKGEHFQDWGCRPFQAVEGIKTFGMPYDEDWPLFDERGNVRDAALNVEPPFDVFEKASAFEVTGIYRIDTDGESRVRDVMQAIAAGYPVAFGTSVDEAFIQHVGPTPVLPARGKIVGGHMMCFVGYETLPTGQVIFRGLNSWSEYWGDKGFFNARSEFLTDDRLDSLYAFTIGARVARRLEE